MSGRVCDTDWHPVSVQQILAEWWTEERPLPSDPGCWGLANCPLLPSQPGPDFKMASLPPAPDTLRD